MKRIKLAVVWVLVALAVSGARAETVAEGLLKSYESVESFSCEMRRDKPLPNGETLRMLSRILYQRPNRLNAENMSPIPRRTVSDGVIFRQYMKGAANGFSRPVADLNEEMAINLRMLPGSNANILEPLRGLEEEELPASAEGFRQVGYRSPSGVYTVLSLDGDGRWVCMEVFSSAARTDRLARTVFSDFKEVVPGVWLACRQESEVRLEEGSAVESVRLSQVAANMPIPASAFDGEAFFPGVEFVDSFEKIGMK